MKTQTKTVNDIVNVRDIRDDVMYTRDGYIITLVRIYPYNIDLLPKSGKRAKTDLLVSQIGNKKINFVYLSYPREVDLTKHINFLRSQYESEITSPGRKRLLAEEIKEASELVLSGENFEHQQFIKLWKTADKESIKSRNELIEVAEDFVAGYAMTGIKAERLKTQELIKACNLFTNSSFAVFDTTSAKEIGYPSIPVIK